MPATATATSATGSSVAMPSTTNAAPPRNAAPSRGGMMRERPIRAKDVPAPITAPAPWSAVR